MANIANPSTNGGSRRTLVKRLVEGGSGLGKSSITGLTPYLVGADLEVFEPEILSLVRDRVASLLGAEPANKPAEVTEPLVRDVRARLYEALAREHLEKIDGTDLSLTKIKEAYTAVLGKLLDDYVAQSSEARPTSPVTLPDEVIILIREGKLFATEDLRNYIAQDRVAFISKISGIEPKFVQNNQLVLQHFESLAIHEFQKIFDPANIKLLDSLHMRLENETDDQMSDRIDDRQSEAVAFLEEIYRAAEILQQSKIDAWKKLPPESKSVKCPTVLTAHKPKDLSFKRFSDLVELIFYPNAYPVGVQRRFAAQQILVLTLLYDFIHRYPAFKMRIESARRLHNALNLALEGRAGRKVEGVYVDKLGDKSLQQDEQFCAQYDGVREFKLMPRYVASQSGTQVLFADGFLVGIESRCKTPSSSLLKLLNKGDIGELTDLVGMDFVIDDREMDHDTLCRTIVELKAYIKDMWYISEFAEDYTGITDPEGAQVNNPSSSPKFVNEKVVFYHLVKGVRVPVEVQFKTLKMKLEAEAKNSEASHEKYRLTQTVKRRAFGDLFPEPIVGDFASIAAEVESSLQQKLRVDEAYEASA